MDGKLKLIPIEYAEGFSPSKAWRNIDFKHGDGVAYFGFRTKQFQEALKGMKNRERYNLLLGTFL